MHTALTRGLLYLPDTAEDVVATAKHFLAYSRCAYRSACLVKRPWKIRAIKMR
jgi:beta-glucosidase-like glycosyl hydrolase